MSITSVMKSVALASCAKPVSATSSVIAVRKKNDLRMVNLVFIYAKVIWLQYGHQGNYCKDTFYLQKTTTFVQFYAKSQSFYIDLLRSHHRYKDIRNTVASEIFYKKNHIPHLWECG